MGWSPLHLRPKPHFLYLFLTAALAPMKCRREGLSEALLFLIFFLNLQFVGLDILTLQLCILIQGSQINLVSIHGV